MNATRFRRPDRAPPYVFGHRGVRGAAPENTMTAFQLAAESGADGVELDVRLCRTGELVVCHDPTLERFTGGRDVRSVADLDLAALARVDVGGGSSVPSLVEVLEFARGRKLRVNVEMKRDVPSRRAVVRETARMLASLGPQLEDIIVSSFDPWMIGYFAWLLPHASRGCLFAEDQRWLRSGWVAGPLRADAVHPERTLVDEHSCRKWRGRGKLVNVWTVNDVAEAERLAELGVDAIITDVPRIIGDAVRR
jgi:glycerophosphoryl diester phosphodiesterase